MQAEPSLICFFHFKNVSIRQITDADVETTVAIINTAYAYQDKAKGKPRTSSKHLREKIKTSEFYVLEQAGCIVGCVYVERSGASIHFGLLTITQEFRGIGLGAAVMAALGDYANALNMSSLELDYMSLAPWLKDYYERYGYKTTGHITPWGTIELIRMVKRL